MMGPAARRMVGPDFVVVGGQAGDGKVMLMASNTLTNMELEERYDEQVKAWGGDPTVRWGGVPPYANPRNSRKVLQAEMGDYVIIHADTYAQAWQDLFDHMMSPAWESAQTRTQILTHYTFAADSRGRAGTPMFNDITNASVPGTIYSGGHDPSGGWKPIGTFDGVGP